MRTFGALVVFAIIGLGSVATGAELEKGAVVNINTATSEELQALPNIGPAKAAAILDWRRQHGMFKRIEDLARVKGFGRKTVARLKELISVSGPAKAGPSRELGRTP